MCLAVPGKVLEIKEKVVTVEYPMEKRDVFNSGVDVKVGDYVMVQMGVIVKKMPEEEAKVMLEAWGSE
ncbi:HypC/HybG/HupF family hydrogenase formation chaperone [Patescibacteria group bacterium]|nr:HypC/HybG/HupF family hydrogenase formation chaperone [Patescibacteria group bacterium]